MPGIFGNYGPTSAGGVVGMNAAAQQAPQVVQQLPMQPLPGIMGQTSPGYAALSNMGYGWRSGGLVGALLGAGYGAQTGGFIDPQMAQMQLMGQAVRSIQQQNPNMPLAEILARLQNPELQKQLYGINQVGEVKGQNGVSVPAINNHGNVAPLELSQQTQQQMSQLAGPRQVGEVKAGEVSAPLLTQGSNISLGLPPLNAAAPNASPMQQLMDLGAKAAQQKAAAEATGKVQGTNAANLPQTLDFADNALKNIDAVAGDPDLKWTIGAIAGRVPAVTGHQADLVNRITQLQSQTMLQGFQALRGAGRITQAEMFKAGDALGRLNRVSSEEGFKQALNDLRSVVVAARTRAGPMAGGQPTPPSPSGVTQSGIKWSVQ